VNVFSAQGFGSEHFLKPMTETAFKSEDQLQAHCFQWTWNQFPETRKLFFSVPNGGTRNTIEAAKFKATGLIAGVADMILLWKAKAYFFEFKFENGKQSQSQKEFEFNVIMQGFDYYLVKDADEFKIIFTKIVTK
jgi:hypothetical protein